MAISDVLGSRKPGEIRSAALVGALPGSQPRRLGESPADRHSLEAELQRVLAQLRATLPREEPGETATPRFDRFAREWLDRQKAQGGAWGRGLADKSAKDLDWRLNSHLLPFFGGQLLDEITVERVDAYRVAKVREGRLCASTINKTISTLATILDVAVEYGLIDGNPARGRRRRLASPPPPRPMLERADQIAALLDAAGELDARAPATARYRRALLAVLAFAGLRIGESLALLRQDVDLERGTITVRRAKTHAGVRVVNVLPALHDELTHHLSTRRGISDESLLFATRHGRPLSATNVRKRVISRAVVLANETTPSARIPERLTPHSLRRTYASLLFALGESPPYVMSQMGHTTPNLTLAIYARQMGRRDGEPRRLQELVG